MTFRSRWTVAVVVLVGAYGTCRACRSAPDSCPLAPQSWNAEPPYHDYLDRVSFEDAGRGRMVQGDHQVIRIDVDFEYRVVDDDAIEFTARDDGGTRVWRVPFRIESGDFEVDEPPPSGPPETVHYGCRLRFERKPWPSVEDTVADYYACRL